MDHEEYLRKIDQQRARERDYFYDKWQLAEVEASIWFRRFLLALLAIAALAAVVWKLQ